MDKEPSDLSIQKWNGLQFIGVLDQGLNAIQGGLDFCRMKNNADVIYIPLQKGGASGKENRHAVLHLH